MSKSRVKALTRRLDKAMAQHDLDEILRIDRELRKLEEEDVEPKPCCTDRGEDD